MTRTITTALLMAALALPAISSEVQPDPLANRVPGVFYAAGRSYLGVDIQDVTTDRLSALKLKEERGVEITMVDNDAPAGKAGLREHDVILEFNGTAVESEEQLRRLIREIPPGRTISLGISREGNPMKISVQLADHSKVIAQSRPRVMVAPMPRVRVFPRNSIDIPGLQLQMYSSVLGIQTENLTRQLGDFFGVKEGEGVLVRSVEKGSAAEKAGLKAGDVIVRANNEKLTDRTDLSHILRNHREAGKMTLVVIRDKHEQTIVVTLPDRGSRDSSGLILDSLDSEELESSLDKATELVAALDTSELASLGSDLADLADLSDDLPSLDLVDQDTSLLELLPESGNTLRDAERQMERARKVLKGLSKHSDPI